MNEAAAVPGVFERIYNWFPTLDREERQELYGRIRSGAVGGPDFYIMQEAPVFYE